VVGGASAVKPAGSYGHSMASVTEHGEESPSLLDPETLRSLLHQLESTDIDELEVVQGDSRVFLRREPGHRGTYVRDEPAEAPLTDPAFAITAPLTGVFWGRPSPEQSAFVSEGEFVEPGQVVALIETMKLFNEVTADVFGKVTRIAVADGDLVELGEELLYVEPTEAGEPE
jgi:acetyl-CoA carboxylase biotin carboxyl carrier protein